MSQTWGKIRVTGSLIFLVLSNYRVVMCSHVGHMTKSISCCRRYHRECIQFRQIYYRVHFMLSNILQSPFYVVRYITESILCCQIYHRVHFMLSTKHTTDNTVFEAPFPWTTQSQYNTSMADYILLT